MSIKKKIFEIARNRIMKSFRKKNHNTDFTLISQNCIGGVIYKNLGLEFRSPTINMFIEDENFVKLVENLEYYMSLEAEALCEKFVDPIDKSFSYPKIKVGDIELCCLHYKSCQEAIDSWERRRKRVNLNNVYVIANSWNLHENEDLIKRLSNLKYKTVIFTYQSYKNEKCIDLTESYWTKDIRNIVRPNLTDRMPYSAYKYFEKKFDFVKWLNSKE